MDLSQGKFVDDTEETILVGDKIVNGYGSDTPHVTKLRYGANDAPSTYARQEEKSFSFFRNLAAAGATTLTSGWYGVEMAGASTPNFIQNIASGYGYYADLLFKSGEELESPEYMAKWAEREKEEESIVDTVKEIHKRSNEVAGKIGEALGAGEEGWGTFLGQTTGSVLTSLGVCYLTKNPTLTAIAFSMPTYENVLGTSVEKGKDLSTSEGIALASSTATGILERWGFQNLIENVATKTVKGAIAKSIATEGIEEISQQVAEDVPLIFWAEDEQFVDETGKIKWMAVVKDLAAAGFGGALGGGIGGGIGASYVGHKRNKVIKGLMSNGKYTRGEAEAIVSYLETGDKKDYEDFIKSVPQIGLAKKAMDSVKEDMADPKKVSKAMTESMNDILDPANLPNGSLDDFAKMVKDSKEQLTEQMVKEAEAERKKYDVRDIVQEKGGSDKTTVDATKEAVQAFAESEAEEFGITPRDVVEGKAITLANLTDNSGLSPEEKQQILEQSGLAKEGTVIAKESGEAPTQDELDEAFAMMKEEQEQEGKEPEDNVFMQTAYHGTGSLDLEGGRFKIERIGTGEGHDAHGHGVYATAEYSVADKKYREMLANALYGEQSNFFDENLLQEEYNKQEKKASKSKSQKEWDKLALLEDMLVKHEEMSVLESNEFSEDVKEWYNKNVREKVINKNRKQGNVFSLDIPENAYLINEQLKYENQPDIVKEAIDYEIKTAPDNYPSKKKLLETYRDKKGNLLYLYVADIEYFKKYGTSEGFMSDKSDAKKLASDRLHSLGVKGITYNGYEDGRSFVIFNPDDVKVIRKFYQGEEKQPRAFANITDASNILVGMLNSSDISALPHEMAHVFTNLHVQNCIKYGKFNSIEGIMKYFGVTNPMELIQNRDIQERLARMSVQYVNEGEAPTAGLRRYFEMFKRFGKKLVSGWKEKGLIDEDTLPDEVRKFFDSLLGKKKHGKIDYARIAEQKAEVIQAIKRIKAGEAVDVSGLPISEVRKLMKVMQTRIPRMPQNLKNALIQAGGVDIDFAKNFDFVQTSGEEKNYRLFKRNGAINSEDSLISFLETNGFITKADVEDYEDTSSQWERVENAMENMNDIYREQDIAQVLERESIEEGIQQAQEIISAVGAEDAFEVIEDIDKLKGRVVAEKEYLESLERRIKNLDADYKKLYDQLLKDQAREFAQETKEQVKQAKEEIKDYRNQVIDFIKKQDLELKDKAKLISVVKKANTKASFEKVISEVKERAADLYRKEQVRRLSDLIQKEVSTRRPALKNQKYAYEENKLFSDLREWNKLNKSDAGIRYQAMHSDEDFMSNLTREDEIRLLFLEYKAMGADSSPQLLGTLLNYIEIAKQVGMEARNEQEYQKAMSRDETKDEMIKQLETRKGKPTIYVKFVANLYSSLKTIFGKDIADKYELETIQNRANIRAANHIDKVVKEAMKLYGVKSKGAFLNVLAELGKKAATITTVNNNIDTPLSKVGITRELSTLEIMDIYNAIKNEKTRDDYYYWYGKDQIDSLLSRLTNNEMIWADMMMESVDERYAPVNEVFVKTYYTDLPKVDNYWMATSEHKDVKTVFDVQNDFNQQSPSFLKERVKGRVLPKPMNAYSKYTKHIKGTYWVTDMADKQVELLNLLSSLRVKNAIENKLGKDTYKALKRQVEALSFGGLMEDVDYVTGIIDKAINNVVVAKISLGIPVFTGQLSSVGLYAENMGVGKWALGFAEGLAHPVQTYKFMKDNVGDFLSARFGSGYDETIESVIRASEEGKGKYSLDPKTKYNVIQALTSFVRTGDIGAIIYGGYPRLKQLLETMPREEAIREFEKETLRGQQSSVAASKSAFQQRKGMARVFTSFRNFQYQAVRKIVDSVYAYINGEVSATQAGKTIGLYAIYAPIAYELFRQLGNMIFFGRDPLKDIENKLFNAVLMQELSIVPIVNDVINYAIKKYFGQYAKSGITTIGIDDLFRSVDKIYKKKKDVYDYGEVVSPFIEMMTGVPSQRIISTTKKVLEKYK